MMITRSSGLCSGIGRLGSRAMKTRQAGKHPFKLPQREANLHALSGDQSELPNGPLVLAAALLHHRQGLANLTAGLEIARGDDSVREITEVHWGNGLGDQPVLGKDQDGQDALLV